MSGNPLPLLAVLRQESYADFLALKLAPASAQETWLALFSFQREIGKIAEITSDEMTAAIRLQWWQETLQELAAGKVRRHEVTELLAAALGRQPQLLPPLQLLIAARAADSLAYPFAQLKDMQLHAEATTGRLFGLLAQAIAPAEDTAQAVRLGTRWGMLGLMRATPYWMPRGRCLLPEKLLTVQGVSLDQYGSAAFSAAVARVVQDVIQSLGTSPTIQPAPFRLYTKLLSLYLRRLQRIDYDIMQQPMEISRLRMALAAFVA